MVKSAKFYLLLAIIGTLLPCSVRAGLPGQLKPIGVFANHTGDGDHTYGYQLMLWKSGTRLIGQMTHWSGDIEGRMGEFTAGRYDSKNGTIQFTVSVRRSSEAHGKTAIFEGKLTSTKVSGKIVWKHKTNLKAKQNETAKLNMQLNDKIQLYPFVSVTQWKNNRYKRSKFLQ